MLEALLGETKFNLHYLKSIEILGTKSTIEEAFFRALPHTLLYVP
jgi:hypothetical protein